MGPTNIALVKFYQADQAVREAQRRLDSASESVRGQQRKINELSEKLKGSQLRLRETQSKAAQLELDVKARTEKIDKLREQQQASQNHKEYQAFLTEINTFNVDRAKVEEETLVVMETVEQAQTEVKEISAAIETERQKHDTTTKQLSTQLAQLQAEIDKLTPARDEAAQAIPARVRDMFVRLLERFDDGEAMGAISKPNKRYEEYVCTACNMDLVADVYNKLHSRDEPVPCPNCQRLLYIPADLPPELALNKPKERKAEKKEEAQVGE